jgi:hypothetical protein
MAQAKKKPVVVNAVAATLADRQKTHGDFTDFSRTDRALKAVLANGVTYESLSDDKKSALDMITHKIARILSGNPNAKDHWHDIQGYAKLAEDRCIEE